MLLLQRRLRKSQFPRASRPRTRLPNLSLPVRPLQIPLTLLLQARLRLRTAHLHRAEGLAAATDSKAGPAGLAKAREVGKEAGGAPSSKWASTATARIRATLITQLKTSKISVPLRGNLGRRPLPM